MTVLFWRLEWQRALARRRLLRLNVAVPLVLVAALVLGGAPAAHAALAYATLFVFFGTFGSAIPLVRDAETGLLGRLSFTGIHEGGFLVQRSLAGAALDAVQLLPSVLLIGVAGQPGRLPTALLALALALLVCNVLGAWIAAVARSVAEAALFAAVVALLLLHASGVFRAPAPGGVGALVESLAPFTTLSVSLRGLAGVEAPPAALGSWLATAVWSGLCLAVSGSLGGSIVRRLCGAARGSESV